MVQSDRSPYLAAGFEIFRVTLFERRNSGGHTNIWTFSVIHVQIKISGTKIVEVSSRLNLHWLFPTTNIANPQTQVISCSWQCWDCNSPLNVSNMCNFSVTPDLLVLLKLFLGDSLVPTGSTLMTIRKSICSLPQCKQITAVFRIAPWNCMQWLLTEEMWWSIFLILIWCWGGSRIFHRSWLIIYSHLFWNISPKDPQINVHPKWEEGAPARSTNVMYNGFHSNRVRL